jgi:hypothetical protein
MLIQRLIIGAIAVATGTIMLKYNYQLVGLTGRQDWIENKLGSGSTYLAYKLLALLVIISGLLYASGFYEPLLRILLSPLADLFRLQ